MNLHFLIHTSEPFHASLLQQIGVLLKDTLSRMDTHFVPIDCVTFWLREKALSTCHQTTGLYYFFFHASKNGWGGELKWHLIPLTWSYYSAVRRWLPQMRVNCSFSDPIRVKNVVKSLHVILLMPSSSRGATRSLTITAYQCVFSPPHPYKIKAQLWAYESSHWLHMRDKVQKQLSNFRALTDPFVVLLK